MEEIEFSKIYDYHAHISMGLLFSCCLDFDSCFTAEQVLEKAENFIPGSLNIGLGWHPERFNLKDKSFDSLPPAAFVNYTWHGFTCSRKAEELLKPAGIITSPRTPLEYETALPGLLSFFAANYAQDVLSTDALKEAVRSTVSGLDKRGIYGSADMMYVLPEKTISILPEAFKKHIYFSDSLKSISEKYPLKLFGDGALGAYTANISAGYLKEDKRVSVHTDSELAEIFAQCQERNRDLAVHAIGDAAAEQYLRAYEKIKADCGNNTFSMRLEHCQFITEEQARRAKKLQVKLCMQPNFSTDSKKYADRLSADTLKSINPFRMLIDKAGFIPGEDLLFGSDGMPSGAAEALQCALFPPFPEQRLTFEELCAGYKADASFGSIKLIVDHDAGTVRYSKQDLPNKT